MPKFDASTGECWVRVYREGVAAAVGHDLVFNVGEFSVQVDPANASVRAQFKADSLRVLGTPAEVDDGEAPGIGGLSARDKSKIEDNLQKKVLQTQRFAVISFESTHVTTPVGHDGHHAFEVHGTLSLHGVERAIRVAVTTQADASVARVRLHQPDFGIAPFRALMGALKVRADVDIELRLPLGKDALSGLAGGAA